MTTTSLVLESRHHDALRATLLRPDGEERAAYLLCGEAAVGADPWDRRAHRQFVVREVLPVPEAEVLSASGRHVTWSTDSFVRALRRAKLEGLHVALVHAHPGGPAAFSDVDDANEPDLLELAQHRNGPEAVLPSLILTGDGTLTGRVWWSRASATPMRLVRQVGARWRVWYPGRGDGRPSPQWDRQALAFGPAFTDDLRRLRIGVVGCGGTGSAVAMLLARLGVGQLVLFDEDVVEATNLNRLHGATQADADALRPKVEVVAREVSRLGLGVRVVPVRAWVGDSAARDALKACDVVFGCTDDHDGRMLLNRFAYCYLTPVIDVGLAIEVSRGTPPTVLALDGRVTVLEPGSPCLVCRRVVSGERARAEALRRMNPTEYERQKREAYVAGEGNPAPAVVTFTTEVAAMGVEELMQRLQGFRGADGSCANRVRKFGQMEDRRVGAAANQTCPVCGAHDLWGRGNIEPFLDRVG